MSDEGQSRAAGRPVRHPARVAAGLLALLFAASALALHPVYDTNDDVAMARIAAGDFGGEARPFPVYSNLAVGLALAKLYRSAPAVDWYPLYLYAAHALAIGSLFCLLLERAPAARGLLFCGLAFGVVYLPYLTRLQFTTTAVWLALSGALCVLAACEGGRGPRRGRLAWGVALLLLASLVRVEGALLGLGLALPALALGLWRTRSRALALGLVLALALAAAADGASRRSVRSDPAWAEYLDYAALLSRFHDTAAARFDVEDRDALRAVGWSPNDARLFFRQWFFQDPAVYSAQRVAAALALAEAGGPSLEIGWLQFRAELAKTRWTLLLAPLFLGLLASARRRELLVLLAAMTAVALGSGLLLAAWFKVVDRVWNPLFDAITPVTLFWLARQDAAGFPRADARGRFALRRPALLWLVLTSACYGHLLLRTLTTERVASELNAKRQERLLAALARLRVERTPEGQPTLLVEIGPVLPVDWLSPLHSRGALRRLELLPDGWLTFSPYWRAFVERHGLSDVYLDAARRDDVVLIARRGNAHRFEQFVREHRGVDIALEPLPGFRALAQLDGLTAYRARLVPAGPGAAP